MKQQMKIGLNVLLVAGAVLAALSSCTKQLPFKNADPDLKEQVYSKALINTNDEYIYSASQQNSSMSADAAFPYSSGENKRVNLKVTEKSLQIYEKETDQRYASNLANDKLVLSIPIEHVNFKCAEDAYGECTNTEANDTSIPWDKRKDIRLKFDELKNAQLELLPVLDSATFGDNCYEEVSTPEVLNYKIESDAINFQIRRNFKTNINCLGASALKISDGTFSATYHYSLVKASSVVSKDYETISYPENSKDERSFGFFSTQKLERAVDHNINEKSVKQIMNRWNPNREKITYYLSDEFAKPENATLKKLTYKTVEEINNGLKKSGTKFTIDLQEPAGKIPGDIRNSMIVLVEDPVASSVIGYGPQTEDPVTGEIVSARTIMFLGTIKSYIKETYADILEQKALLKKASPTIQSTEKSAPKVTLGDDLARSAYFKVILNKGFGINAALKAKNEAAAQKKAAAKAAGQEKAVEALTPDTTNQVARAVKNLKNYTNRKNLEYAVDKTDPKSLFKAKFKYLNEVKNCAFTPSGTAGGIGLISQKLLGKFKDNAKQWHLLSESEKQEAIDIILPEIWVPTLIHEIGHNLGLRHNFAASEDKNNYFSDEELVHNHIDHKVPFSSVMDYGNDLRTLSVMGKYDVAALKFAYDRKVDIVDKDQKVKTIAVKDTLSSLVLPEGATLKEYKYCTDENVGSGAGCQRFDLGASYVEMVQNKIDSYYDAYKYRNFKNGRRDMSVMDDMSYVKRLKRYFDEIRDVTETREFLVNKYNIPDDHPMWTTDEWLADINEASKLGGQFLAKIIAIPDLTCVIAAKDAPTKVAAMWTLAQIDDSLNNCFEVKPTDITQDGKYMVIAEFGKSFLSRKLKGNPSSSADQIDVRGIWPDKVAALQTLLTRRLGDPINDEYKDSYLNDGNIRNELLSMFQSIMTNDVVDTLEFRFADGQTANIEGVPYDMASSQKIPEPMIRSLYERAYQSSGYEGYLDMWRSAANSIELNANGVTSFQRLLSRVISRESIDPDKKRTEDIPVSLAFSIEKRDSTDRTPISRKDQSMIINATKYVASANNIIATNAMNDIKLMKMINALSDDLQTRNQKLVAIYQAKKQGQATAPEAATLTEKAVWALDVQTLESVLSGVTKDIPYNQNLIEDLVSVRL